MDGKWGKCGMLALLLGILVGCRTTPPNVKPVEQPEVLNNPPRESRFDRPGMPKEVFTREDPLKRLREMENDNAVAPARASFGGPNSTGMMR